MGLLDTIRSLLGLDSGGDGSDRGRSADRRSTDVRVEHHPNEGADVDAESEAAVKGTDDAPEHTGDALAAGADAAASTGSLTEEPDAAEEAAEPAEAAGPTPDAPDVEVSEDEDESEGVAEAEAEGTTDGTGAGEESVEVIRGIGQAYGKRLSDAGVETVADLAAADAADLADASGISERRIAGWKESAQDRLE